jgi:hypothetical protein
MSPAGVAQARNSGNPGHVADRAARGQGRVNGRPPDALEPDFHGVRTRWIRGFMAFRLTLRTRTVRLMVSA